MNKDQVQGKYAQIKGKLKETWGRLTDDQLAFYEGNREKFIGKVQEEYGIAREEIEKHLKAMEEAYQKKANQAA